jgi:hypothetical protein
MDSTRPKNGNVEKHLERLGKALAKLDARDLLDFEKIHVEMSHESYDARLWNVMAILCGGGCGDDSFDYFRSWLIMQGEAAFRKVLKQPERIPEWYPPGKLDYADGFGSLARTAFEEQYADRNFDAEYDGPEGPGELKGKLARTEEDLEAMFPDLCEKYPGGYD